MEALSDAGAEGQDYCVLWGTRYFPFVDPLSPPPPPPRYKQDNVGLATMVHVTSWYVPAVYTICRASLFPNIFFSS